MITPNAVLLSRIVCSERTQEYSTISFDKKSSILILTCQSFIKRLTQKARDILYWEGSMFLVMSNKRVLVGYILKRITSPVSILTCHSAIRESNNGKGKDTMRRHNECCVTAHSRKARKL